jgi:hypothetical protein
MAKHPIIGYLVWLVLFGAVFAWEGLAVCTDRGGLLPAGSRGRMGRGPRRPAGGSVPAGLRSCQLPSARFLRASFRARKLTSALADSTMMCGPGPYPAHGKVPGAETCRKACGLSGKRSKVRCACGVSEPGDVV